MYKIVLILFIVFSLSGCYQTANNDEFNTKPITNNPTIVPNNSSIPNL